MDPHDAVQDAGSEARYSGPDDRELEELERYGRGGTEEASGE